MKSKIINKQVGIVTELKKRIESRFYPERLPSTSALAAEFGVNAKTMNKAMNSLAEEGIITRFRKKGSLIRLKHTPSSVSDTLIELLFVGSAQISVHPYFGEMWSGIMDGLKDSRYKLILSELDENQESGGLAHPYNDLTPCAGRLLIGSNVQSQLEILARQPQPFVLVGEKAHDRLINCVYPDVYAAMEQVVRSLYHSGISKVGFIGMTHGGECIDMDKFHAYLAAIQACGLKIDGDLIEHVPPFARYGYPAMLSLLKRKKPQVVLMAFDHQYPSARRAMEDVNLANSDKIKVLGIDGLEMFPEIRKIKIPRYEIGFKSIRLLLDILSGKVARDKHEIVFKAKVCTSNAHV